MSRQPEKNRSWGFLPRFYFWILREGVFQHPQAITRIDLTRSLACLGFPAPAGVQIVWREGGAVVPVATSYPANCGGGRTGPALEERSDWHFGLNVT